MQSVHPHLGPRAATPVIRSVPAPPASIDATLPYDPRVEAVDRSLPGLLGSAALRGLASLAGFSAILGLAWSEPLRSASAKRSVRRAVLEQLFLVGFRPVVMVSTVAFFVGATVALQALALAPATSGELLGQVLAVLVIRELGPLVTAVLITARSGTAIATELGNMSARDELVALESLGIPPAKLIVWPRAFAIASSVVVLSIYFAGVALIGGASLVGAFGSGVTPLLEGLRESLGARDLGLFLFKALGLGLAVAVIVCHSGLNARRSGTRVPENTSRAVMTSLFVCVVLNTVTSVLFYWLVGWPFR